MVSLLVKGSKVEALAAARKRGIPATWRDPSPHADHGGESYLNVDSSFLSRVLAWYLESNVIVPGQGYEVGTLLHYGECREAIF